MRSSNWICIGNERTVCVEEINTEDSRPDRLGFGEKLLFTRGISFNGAVDNNACFSSTSLVALHAGILCIYVLLYIPGSFFSDLYKTNKNKTHTSHWHGSRTKKWCLGLLGWIVFLLSLGKVQLVFRNDGDHYITNTDLYTIKCINYNGNPQIYINLPYICILWFPIFFVPKSVSKNLPEDWPDIDTVVARLPANEKMSFFFGWGLI